MSGMDWKRAAAVTITLTGALLLIYFVGKFAVGLLLPFLLAFLLALITRPAVLWLSARTNCPRRVLSVAVTLAALLLLFVLCYWIAGRLLSEIKELLSFLAEDLDNGEGRIARILSFLRGALNGVPFFEKLGRAELLQYYVGNIDEFAGEQLRMLLSRLSERVTALLVSLLGSTPSLLVFLSVTLISCFYFSAEYETVWRALSRLIPARYATRLPRWRKRAGGALRRYLRAYFLLFLLTFAELLIGFMILGTGYAFLLAFMTALLDALPVLGVGTILLPYAIFSFMAGDRSLGFGLLILYGVITLVRQFVEPHLVGKSLGLHPILMLMAFYVGFRLFGVAGIFLGPAAALILKYFFAGEDAEPQPPQNESKGAPG